MIIVLDTNTLVQGLDATHSYYPITNAWRQGQLNFAVSTDILFEYEEVITRMSAKQRWLQFAAVMDLTDAVYANLLRVSPSFHFRAISVDRDDDKFADCAKHFQPLIGSGYKPQPIAPNQFIRRFLTK